jgi:hypothetical protein
MRIVRLRSQLARTTDPLHRQLLLAVLRRVQAQVDRMLRRDGS